MSEKVSKVGRAPKIFAELIEISPSNIRLIVCAMS